MPVINFLAAIGIGIVIGLIGGFALRGRQPNAIWLAPVLAVAGALVASILALILGDPEDYGYREPILQVVLAAVGVGVVAFLGSRNSSPAADAPATE
jgi:uncharacterized membrane protein YeaQ/YmgE (transglycosylase-associated protein family)